MKWTKKRKLDALAENLSDVELFDKYGVTVQEADEWRRKIAQHGPGALRVTKETLYRRK